MSKKAERGFLETAGDVDSPKNTEEAFNLSIDSKSRESNSPKTAPHNPKQEKPELNLAPPEIKELREQNLLSMDLKRRTPQKSGSAHQDTQIPRVSSKASAAEFFSFAPEFLSKITKEGSTQPGRSDPECSHTPKPSKKPKLQGTLLGVFFPCLQNILGVLLFIRVPSITGEAGILYTLLIVFLCTSTTFFTVLSMSAIATNGKIKSGGTYYMISRCLGPPAGASVGILFYLGTSFAAALYILGAVESFISVLGIQILGKELDMRLLCFVLLFFLIVANLVGLSVVAKLGLFFLVVVLISVLSMYVGTFSAGARGGLMDGISGMSGRNLEDNYGPKFQDNSFIILLSIYYPSVTGIMAGSNRSGDLKNPSVSIPKGTLAAQLTSTFIYLSFPIFFAAAASREALMTEDKLFSAEISLPRELVQVGIILSSVGAGLQSLAGAPRLLQAIANDRLIPIFNPFAKGIRRNILITAVISFGAIMIGSVNAVAPIQTIFFLMCYAFVNAACFLLSYLGSPNWRPTFRFFGKTTAFLGGALCVGLMFTISWWIAIIAITFALLLYIYIDYNTQTKNWGDGISGMRFERAKDALLRIKNRIPHVKNWKPRYLALGNIFKQPICQMD
jgi:solute carrier family 12 (potassium/chloride transporter), member 4/6